MFSPIFDWLDQMGTWGVALKAILLILVAVLTWLGGTKSIAIVALGWIGYKERNGEPIRMRHGYEHLPKHERPLKEYRGFNLMLPWIDNMRLVCNLEELRDLAPVKVTVQGRTHEVHPLITIRAVDGEKFLYVHGDPRAQVNTSAQSIVQQVLTRSEWVTANAIEAALMEELPPMAARYGIEIVKVLVVSCSEDGSMAQAGALGQIAKALTPRQPSSTP